MCLSGVREGATTSQRASTAALPVQLHFAGTPGARSVLNAAKNKTDSTSRWAVALSERRGYWRAVVAIAAKNARMAWAVLSLGEHCITRCSAAADQSPVSTAA